VCGFVLHVCGCGCVCVDLRSCGYRLGDISPLPEIVKDIRELLFANADLDPRQHRLVFFREVRLSIYIHMDTVRLITEGTAHLHI